MKLWIAALCLVHIAVAQNCDESQGWKENNGVCFRISRNAAETQYTWQEARAACGEEGGDLASMRDQSDRDFILGLADEIGFTGGTLWHGMNQLADTSGDFTWSDGSEQTYEDWAINEPRDGGITNCAFTITEPIAGDFQRYDYSSATIGLLEPGYDRPTDADGVDTFYFGGGWDKDAYWCESQCAANPNCYGYTWYYYHWDYYWEYTCVGRSDKYDILGYDSYGTAGVRTTIGGSGNDWWYAGNCGLNKGFACRKDFDSNTPVTPAPTVAVDGYCPEGYKGVGNKCLKVVVVADELDGFRWQEAIYACRDGPGINPDIASIHSDEENALVTHELQQMTYGVWIGYHYATQHQRWVWADNSEPRYTNWDENQPGDVTELCVEMWATSSTAGKWHNQRCDSRRGYVCQTYKDPNNVINTPQATTEHTCADGWTPYWYGCYKLDSTARTWTSARDNCDSLGGSLVSIHHEAENSAVYLMANGDFPVWMGLKTNEEGYYEWVDGWPYGYYMNWDDNAIGAGNGCVVMKSNQKWNDTMCENSYPSICKQTDEPVPTVPEGGEGYCPLGDWEEFGSYCYWFSDTTALHDQAVADCQVQAGSSHYSTLASIENQYENEWILDHVRSDPYNYGTWIGLIRSQLGLDGFVWLDGSDSMFRNWGPGEPNDPYYENCVEMWTDSYPGYWNDNRCDYYDYTYKHYVCKASKGDMPTTPQMPTPGDQTCPSGNWDVWGDNCLLIRPNDYRNWDEALSLCQQMGGSAASLASIHSYEENWYIHGKVNEYNYDDYYNPDVWIGLYKLTYGYPYEWINGVDVTYLNWAPGEPNDRDGSQNCARMYHINGYWDDYYCYEYYYHGYICQTRQDLFKKELAEKGPDFFKSPDDFPPHVEVNRAKVRADHRKPGKERPLSPEDILEDFELRGHDVKHRTAYQGHGVPHRTAYQGQVETQDDVETSSHAGQQASIVIGCLVGVVAIAAVVSIVVKVKVDKASKKEEVVMVNVITSPETETSTSESSSYDIGNVE